MVFDLTENAFNASIKQQIRPQLVLEIDGVEKVFTADVIQRFIRINCPDLFVGVPLPNETEVWTIGGLKDVEEQSSLISLQSGTSTEIRQSLRIDKGQGETISSMRVALIDKNLEITDLITPGQQVEDILGKRCRIWLGFEGTAWKEDFIIIFRGIIDDIDAGAGLITLNIAHPDQKKRSQIFSRQETQLNGSLSAGASTITVDSTDGFLSPVTGPDGAIDESIKYYVRIDDELIRYTGLTATTFTGATRGELFTAASTHADNAKVESFIQLEGNAIDLALKLMLSGINGNYIEDDDRVTNFVSVAPNDERANAIFFEGISVEQEFGITVGDYVSTSGATNAANNFTGRQIIEIDTNSLGSFLVVDGAALVLENGTSATISLRSQYDSLGTGLQMFPDEVDVAQHIQVKSQFLGSFDYDFYIKKEIDGKQFLSEQIYNPASAFSLPRKSQASVGVHIPPLPTNRIKSIDVSNVLNPSRIKIRRTIVRNFFNEIRYEFEESVLEDEFLRIRSTVSQTSLDRIENVGRRTLNIQSKGIRDILQGDTVTDSAALRRLRKYQFGAEQISNIELNFKTGFDLEVGDVVLLDLTTLKISDIESGTRAGEPRLFEIVNKKINFKNGNIFIDIVDTNFDKDARFGLVSPCSRVKAGISNQQFVIESIGNFSQFGNSEFRKWEDFLGASVVVRNEDGSISDTAILRNLTGNQVTLDTPLSFVPTAGMQMEFDDYDNQPDNVILIYVFMRDSAFADGKPQYQMI